jgi:hypothetical protein
MAYWFGLYPDFSDSFSTKFVNSRGGRLRDVGELPLGVVLAPFYEAAKVEGEGKECQPNGQH